MMRWTGTINFLSLIIIIIIMKVLYVVIIIINFYYYLISGPGSSVGMVTDYGLDSPGSNPGGGRDFPQLS